MTAGRAGWFARLERLAAGRAGVAAMAAWGFAEAVIFPVVPDAGLLLLALAAPRRAAVLLAAVVAGALAGSAVLYAAALASPATVTAALLSLPAIDQPLLAAARDTVSSGAPWSIGLIGPGTPVKVYTLAWATGPATPLALAAGVVLNRVTRIGPGLVLIAALGRLAPDLLRRHERLVVGVYVAGFAVGYAIYWR